MKWAGRMKKCSRSQAGLQLGLAQHARAGVARDRALRPDGGGTVLDLLHERFVDAQARANHERGWTGTEDLEDDRLRLVFTCCHPALAPDAQVALTLREVCGLGTEEIARAFLVPAPTVAQRIVRAKSRIRDARIPYQVPALAELPERLDAVLRVVYLVFNEGYAASSGDSLTRTDLSVEAIRLGRLLVDLLPDPEAMGLLALMLLHDSRRAARTSPTGDIVLLDAQDRSLWHRGQIDEGAALVERALLSRRFGPYTLQAAIAAVHAEAGGPTPPTGRRSSGSTTCCCGSILRPWPNSTAPPPLPCATVRRPGWR
jgi:predicted RNA polymerase sigma factor